MAFEDHMHVQMSASREDRKESSPSQSYKIFSQNTKLPDSKI